MHEDGYWSRAKPPLKGSAGRRTAIFLSFQGPRWLFWGNIHAIVSQADIEITARCVSAFEN